MSAYAISFGCDLLLQHHPSFHPPPEGMAWGWRPFVWTVNPWLAETFPSEAAAMLYARGALKHDQYEIVLLPGHPCGYANDTGDCA